MSERERVVILIQQSHHKLENGQNDYHGLLLKYQLRCCIYQDCIYDSWKDYNWRL